KNAPSGRSGEVTPRLPRILLIFATCGPAAGVEGSASDSLPAAAAPGALWQPNTSGRARARQGTRKEDDRWGIANLAWGARSRAQRRPRGPSFIQVLEAWADRLRALQRLDASQPKRR